MYSIGNSSLIQRFSDIGSIFYRVWYQSLFAERTFLCIIGEQSDTRRLYQIHFIIINSNLEFFKCRHKTCLKLKKNILIETCSLITLSCNYINESKNIQMHQVLKDSLLLILLQVKTMILTNIMYFFFRRDSHFSLNLPIYFHTIYLLIE